MQVFINQKWVLTSVCKSSTCPTHLFIYYYYYYYCCVSCIDRQILHHEPPGNPPYSSLNATQLLLLFSLQVMSDSTVTPWNAACRAALSMGFSRKEYWSGLPFRSSGDLPTPGIKPVFSYLGGGLFTTEPLGKSAT